MRKATRVFGWIVFTIYVIVALGVMGYGIYSQFFTEQMNPPVLARDFGARPADAEKLDLAPIPTDAQGKIEWAYELYCIANLNWLQRDYVAMAVNFDTSMQLLGVDATVSGYQFTVKTPEEYYHTEYSFSVGESIIDDIMQGVARDSTVYALRSYTQKGATKMARQLTTYGTKVKKSDVPTYRELEDGSFEFICLWTDMPITDEKMPQFYPGQPGFQDSDREMTDQRILPETILSAEITYNEEEGYYELVLELDTANPKTTEITQPQLAESSDDPNASYSKMIETIQIWDNGYFRYFHSVDSWSAPQAYGFLPLTSVLDYNTYFYYDDYSTDPNNYQNMVEYRDYLLANDLI